MRWDVIHQCEYVMVDEMAENVEYALEWVKAWAEESDLSAERSGEGLRLLDESHDIQIQLEQADVFDFIQSIKNQQTC